MNRGVLVPVIAIKLLRSSDFRRYSLSVEFFRGPYLAHFRLLRSSSIFSKCGILQRSILSTFSTFEKFVDIF